MDPRNRADEALDRARTRGAFVVTPDNATSPMDASSTVRIPRETVNGADQDPDAEPTVVLPHPGAPDGSGVAWPTTDPPNQHPGDTGQAHWAGQEHGTGEHAPPNPHQDQRSSGEFGRPGSQTPRQNPPH